MVEGLPQRDMNGYTLDQLKSYIQKLQGERGIRSTVEESGSLIENGEIRSLEIA